jgi:hypothetical protein
MTFDQIVSELEKLDRLEALAKDAASGDATAYDALLLNCTPQLILSLIALARVGLAVTPRPISEAPRDGSIIYGFEPYKWVAYKKGAMPDQIKRGGRWQKFNGFGWDNAEPPDAFLPALPKPGGADSKKDMGHDWRISDSSLYDLKCMNCGTTDVSDDADLPCRKPGGDT